MAADSEPGAAAPASSAAPDSVMVRPEPRASAARSSVTYSGLPAAPSASCSRRPSGRPPAEGRHQLGHCRLGERGELDPDRVRGYPPQGQQVATLRHRAHRADQQQRLMLCRLGQPSPQGDTGLVGPLQVVDDQDGGPDRALLGHQGQQLLRQHRGHIRAAVSADLAAQQPDDRAAPGICRRFAHLQPVEERQQRQGLAKFVTGPPEHLVASLRRFGQCRSHQSGLADARLAFDQHRAARAPARHVSYQPRQQCHLAVTSDERTNRVHRVHGANCTTSIFIEQACIFPAF